MYNPLCYNYFNQFYHSVCRASFLYANYQPALLWIIFVQIRKHSFFVTPGKTGSVLYRWVLARSETILEMSLVADTAVVHLFNEVVVAPNWQKVQMACFQKYAEVNPSRACSLKNALNIVGSETNLYNVCARECFRALVKLF